MVNIGIRPSVNSFKTSRDERQGISVRSRIIRLTNNQTKKAENLRPFPKKKRKRRQECGGYCENGISDGMCLERLGVIIGCSKRQTSPGKPDAKSLGTHTKNTIHSVYATSSNYPGKERTIVWKNTSQKSSSPNSLRYEI